MSLLKENEQESIQQYREQSNLKLKNLELSYENEKFHQLLDRSVTNCEELIKNFITSQ